MTRAESDDVTQEPGRVPAGPSASATDDVTAVLAREVYWARDGAARLPADARALLERLDAFAYQVRLDQQQAVPVGETFFVSTTGWRRWLKQLIWRLTRFSTVRYDRLLTELAEMNGELARRLVATEEEIARLRGEFEDRGGDLP